ncbi:rhamnose/proton symporter RhaT [Saccharobesus litoralis]|uniref:Rhamnose/proton symporter RhaT n=1 Tax=Saccharobesus litoralis TaxID=2172099 RepID=A0A2S0VLJ3_9ALTE|nr:L-rhamnose/proton symporter RhaT [Saccharobesus litoralis]AWB65076.1 rhamnose/proton symporter RhaT [Saccharobesus litoralis]
MIEGIIWALLGGLMLGLYALPGKFTKHFEEENTWGLFFMQTMFLVPILVSALLIQGVGDIFSDPAVQAALPGMIIASMLWGVGVMLWGKAIHHIGLSLGFSLFIGTVILVGTLMPIIINMIENGLVAGAPESGQFVLILSGVAIILLGILFNGRAGILREADAPAEEDSKGEAKSMKAGITIAIVGGLLATGFNVAFTLGGGPLSNAVVAAGNPDWMVSLAVMLVVFLSGGVIMAGYFGWQITAKKRWKHFSTPSFAINFALIFVMAFFHYAASVAYGYGASLFALGPVVVYAIFNTTCVGVAVVSGLITKEWTEAPSQARKALYLGLGCMIVGVGVLASSQYLASQPTAEVATVINAETIKRINLTSQG